MVNESVGRDSRESGIGSAIFNVVEDVEDRENQRFVLFRDVGFCCFWWPLLILTCGPFFQIHSRLLRRAAFFHDLPIVPEAALSIQLSPSVEQRRQRLTESGESSINGKMRLFREYTQEHFSENVATNSGPTMAYALSPIPFPLGTYSIGCHI